MHAPETGAGNHSTVWILAFDGRHSGAESNQVASQLAASTRKRIEEMKMVG